MAGDWLPMRLNLYHDPAVISIATECGIEDRDAVVGKLHRLWAWANEHTADGYAARVTKTNIDSLVGVTGFAQAMENVRPEPWLAHDSGGIWFPNFARWNGKSAKSRLQAAFRMKKMRYAGSVTKAQPESESEKEKESASAPSAPVYRAQSEDVVFSEKNEERARDTGAESADAETTKPKRRAPREWQVTAADLASFAELLYAKHRLSLASFRAMKGDMRVVVLFETTELGDTSFRKLLATRASRDPKLADDLLNVAIEVRNAKPKKPGGFVRERLRWAGWNL